MIPDHEAETLLRSWGAFLREEVEAEVGLPGCSSYCREYDAPDWTGSNPNHAVVTADDVQRALWAMIVLRSRRPRVHQDGLDHYRDGRRMGWERLRVVRNEFARVWGEWDRFQEPTNAI